MDGVILRWFLRFTLIFIIYIPATTRSSYHNFDCDLMNEECYSCGLSAETIEYSCPCVRVCVCACVCARARARVCVCVCVWVCVYTQDSKMGESTV